MRHYAYVNGFRNAAWLTGYVEEIKDNCLFISQNGYRNTAVLVFFDEKTKPKGVKVGGAVSIICRVLGQKQGENRIPLLKALGYERPKLLNMPPASAYQIALKHNAPCSQVTPTEDVKTLNPKLNPNSNVVHLAGLVEACVPLPSAKNPGLIVLIKQHRESEQSIPVRLYGGLARAYRSRLKRGMPIMIEGAARMRAEDVVGPDGSKTTTLVPFIQTTDIRIPQRGSEFLHIPPWAYEFMIETSENPELRQIIEKMRSEESPVVDEPVVDDEPPVAKETNAQGAAAGSISIDDL